MSCIECHPAVGKLSNSQQYHTVMEIQEPTHPAPVPTLKCKGQYLTTHCPSSHRVYLHVSPDSVDLGYVTTM
jgi:hypothetical protein